MDALEFSNEDAIKILEWLKQNVVGSYFVAPIDIAIEAMKKQIRNKPKEKHKLGNTDPYLYGYCASCGEPINYEFNYCPTCGQKADWSDAVSHGKEWDKLMDELKKNEG